MDHVSQTLVLNDVEINLFTLLEEVLQWTKLSTIMRVAGGWVRDKLMGKESHDIDIALDNITGLEFAQLVNAYLAHKNLETHTIGVIESNPEQSKHLATATVKIFDSWVDFVNLRSEYYAEDSRIPSTQFGGPKADAERRDLTINSLFYNINSKLIEDFTGKGLEDLQAKIIRTPLDAFKTFMDDPLRVLRSFRFASRLPGFTVDPHLLESASHPDVRKALATKISKERIGKEFEGMLLASRPELAIHWISKLQLFPVVFALPPNMTSNVDMERLGHEASNLVRQFIRATKSIESEWTPEERRIAVLAAALLPLAGCTYVTPKKRIEQVVDYIVMDSVKHTRNDAQAVSLLHYGVQQFELHLHADPTSVLDGNPFIRNTSLAHKRHLIGKVLRRIGPLWHTSLMLAILDHLPDFANDISELEVDPPLQNNSPLIITFYELKKQIIDDLNLDGVWDMKLFLPGDDLQDLINIPPGPSLGVALELQLTWMLAHPSGTKEECKEYLVSPEFREELINLSPAPKANKKKAK